MSEKIRVDEDFIKSLIGNAAWKQEEIAQSLSEEVVEEAATEEEGHVCPLCESHLAEEISDESWESHLTMLDQIAEEVDAEEEGEDLEEAKMKKEASFKDRFQAAGDKMPKPEQELGPQKGDSDSDAEKARRAKAVAADGDDKPSVNASKKVKEMADGEEGDEEKPMKKGMDEKKKKAMERVKSRMEAKYKK